MPSTAQHAAHVNIAAGSIRTPLLLVVVVAAADVVVDVSLAKPPPMTVLVVVVATPDVLTAELFNAVEVVLGKVVKDVMLAAGSVMLALVQAPCKFWRTSTAAS